MIGSGADRAPGGLDEREHAPGKDVFSGFGEMERRASLEWVGEHLPEVKRAAYGERILHWTLGIGLVVGLAEYAGGYALRSSATGEPFKFAGDLLYTLGWALWTGVVVVLFLQVLPETKRRQYKEALDAYEAALPGEGRAAGEGTSGDDDASTDV